jgi:hypothetical protein
MASRYDERKVFLNNSKMYRNVLKKRNVKIIEQYSTPVIRYPSSFEMTAINIIDHIWVRGDHYYKLASVYYKDASLWWVIAQFNQRPIEDFVYGEVVAIPTPVDVVMRMFQTFEGDGGGY